MEKRNFLRSSMTVFTANPKCSFRKEFLFTLESGRRSEVKPEDYTFVNGDDTYTFCVKLKLRPAIRLFFTLVNATKPVEIHHRACLRIYKGCKYETEEHFFTYTPLTRTYASYFKGTSTNRILNCSEFESIVNQSGTKTIKCSFTLSKHCNVSYEMPPLTKNEIGKDLTEDFKDLLLTGRDSDLIIHVEGGSINVHKIVLCARSSVFAGMFRCDASDNTENSFEDTNFSFSSFKSFVHYLYTDEIIPESLENCYQLYWIACDYAVHSLRKRCRHIFSSLLNKDNLVYVLYLAIRHNDIKLINSAQSFYDYNFRYPADRIELIAKFRVVRRLYDAT